MTDIAVTRPPPCLGIASVVSSLEGSPCIKCEYKSRCFKLAVPLAESVGKKALNDLQAEIKTIESLTPDFKGRKESIKDFRHNVAKVNKRKQNDYKELEDFNSFWTEEQMNVVKELPVKTRKDLLKLFKTGEAQKAKSRLLSGHKPFTENVRPYLYCGQRLVRPGMDLPLDILRLFYMRELGISKNAAIRYSNHFRDIMFVLNIAEILSRDKIRILNE